MTDTRTELAAAIEARNPSAPSEVVEAAAALAEERGITVEEIEGDDGEALVGGLTDEAHNNLGCPPPRARAPRLIPSARWGWGKRRERVTPRDGAGPRRGYSRWRDSCSLQW